MAKRREPVGESAAGRAGGKKPRRSSAGAARHLAARLTKARPALAPLAPNVCLVRAPRHPAAASAMGAELTVATYNVHRWTGMSGRREPDPARAAFVISELGADVIALQEVLRPLDQEDPLEKLADALGLHLAFAATRIHRFGELGNAILSRWPIPTVSTLDLSFSRLEKRLAVAASFDAPAGSLGVVATHLALVDRTRHQQVRSLLDHPQIRSGATILLGDMNAWRQCRATRALDAALGAHSNRAWPPSFPSARPVLALDRIYARGARIVEIRAHDSSAARRASDHLPVVARVELPRVH
ncbi:MAG: endonuclease/exonuclease/phosphatase family protein [Deltaproteobacteria bacterium]|nr:endonuclease/exonuclease/phosphatase family protein [Deltaproteobacteria bacterium]